MEFDKRVTFIMNVPKSDGDTFIKREKYAFTFTRPKVRTIIEVEHYEACICVFSFYTDGVGCAKTKYRLRFRYTGVHVLYIFKACLHIFNEINANERHALFFTASNDIGKYDEDNKRYSAYGSFFENYLEDYLNYELLGSLKLNILGLYHRDHPFEDQVLAFYETYKQNVMDELNREDTDK